uniref:MAK10-like protein n=1 Tax=Tanacetum cinerariifolium TaxID=118510 RepID=A0A699GUS9_TANCI|nr:MAK10-like protein [Tanacetum cinerariifolium]
MTTLAEFMIIAGSDSRPPMLEKSMYDSWKSRMELYIENRDNGRRILNLILNGLLVWLTIVKENGTTRTKKYEELLVAEKIQADCVLKYTNIVLQGLPPDVYAIVNHRDDLISCLNKAMDFLSVVATSRFLALGWHLEEIHVTWAHLEKKQTRLQTYTKIQQEVLFSERGDGITSIKRCNRDLSGNGVWILVMASQRSQLKVNLELSAGKLRNKNADESLEIIENLTLYDHEGWNDTKEFIKPVKAIYTPQSTLKIPDRRLLELKDHINFLLKGSRLTPRSSTHIPHAYADAVYYNPCPQYQNESPKLNPFTFRKRTGPSPQHQAFGTTFEARVQDYMAAYTKRMERFKNAIFKQREEINDRMTGMFRLLKELTTSLTSKKVLIREEAKFLVTKNVNSISLARGEEERSDKIDIAIGNNIEKPTRTKIRMQVKEAEKKNEAGK